MLLVCEPHRLLRGLWGPLYLVEAVRVIEQAPRRSSGPAVLKGGSAT